MAVAIEDGSGGIKQTKITAQREVHLTEVNNITEYIPKGSVCHSGHADRSSVHFRSLMGSHSDDQSEQVASLHNAFAWRTVGACWLEDNHRESELGITYMGGNSRPNSGAARR